MIRSIAKYSMKNSAECFSDCANDFDRARERESLVKKIAERLPFDVFHHDERLPGRRFAVIVDHRNVWMA